MSLRLRLSLLVALVSLLAMLLFGTLAYLLFVREQQQQLEQFLNRDIERAQAVFVNPAVGQSLSLSQGAFIQQFVDKQHQVIIPPGSTVVLPFHTEPRVVSLQDKRYLVSSRPWKLSSGLELGTLRVALDISDPLRFRKSLLRSLVISGGVMTLLALAIGLWLLQRSLKPLLRLAEETQHIDPSHPTMTHYLGPNDEVFQVAQALNRALESIRHRQQSERESLAEIAHELSAPLMVVSGHLEALSKQNPDPRLEAAHEAADELLYTSQDLLTLARGELEQTLELSVVNLSDIVERIRKAFPGIQVVSESAEVAGNPERLIQLLRNLVRNAIQATGEAEKVLVRLEAGVAQHRLIVQDFGPGIPEHELPNIFERFYSKRGGAGLGLGIAKRIVEQHGGEIQVSSRLGEGSIFEVVLPSLSSRLDQSET